MKFKKIYLEITNKCNLSCSFCNHTKRKEEFITIDNLKIILDKIKPYTNYLYLHVMGEPLLHPNINEIIDLASTNFNINITTNGYLLSRISNNHNIRQINISLQSILDNNLDLYMTNMFKQIDKLLTNNTIVNLRMWVNNSNSNKIISIIEKQYNIKINGHTKIRDNFYIDFASKFIWPDLNNDYYEEKGNCLALKDHIGILVDGTVIPCCLDSEGLINLGNIYKDSLEDIINSKRFINMRTNFKDNKKIEELCKHCNFYDRIHK